MRSSVLMQAVPFSVSRIRVSAALMSGGVDSTRHVASTSQTRVAPIQNRPPWRIFFRPGYFKSRINIPDKF